MGFLPSTRRQRIRLALVMGLLVLVSIATTLILVSFEKNLMYFRTPSEVLKQTPAPVGVFELGGLVVKDSLQRTGDGLDVYFVVSDGAAALPVYYRGVLPDLFREGQGVIVYGRWRKEGAVDAVRILAKHDEYYMPAHLARKLEEKHPQYGSDIQPEPTYQPQHGSDTQPEPTYQPQHGSDAQPEPTYQPQHGSDAQPEPTYQPQ